MDKFYGSTDGQSSSEQNVSADLRLRHKPAVTSAQFAGRIGGNQAFIADKHTGDTQLLLEKQPDAAPLSSLSSSLDLKGFLEPDLWRMALLEGWGTFLLISLVGSMASGLTMTDQSVFAQTLYAALGNFLGLALFTYGMAPITGGHLNPAITMATFFAGLSTFPRTVLYMSAQSIGGIIAGYWLLLGLGTSYFPENVIPGCTVDPSSVSPGQLFALEYVYAQAMIFVAFGVGLDPRQGKTISPAYAPILIGIILGLGNITTNLAKTGYTGVSFNPARCLGLMTAKQEMQYHYIHWLGPLAAAVVNGIFYHLAPPWTRETPLFAGIFNKLEHGHKVQRSRP